MSKAVPIGFDPAKVNLRVAPLEIRIVLNLEHTAGHPDYLANSKELDTLIADFPNVMQSWGFKLFLIGSKKVMSIYGNYQLKSENGDVSQFIPYVDFRNMGGNVKSHLIVDVPIRILTYECVDDWAQAFRQTQERINESQRLREQTTKHPGPKIPGPSVYG